MKVILKEGHTIVYQKTTHNIVVDIDGIEYIIRQSEDDNGVDLYVWSDELNDSRWFNPYSMEDGELKDTIINLANIANDDYTFSDSNVGTEVDINDYENY